MQKLTAIEPAAVHEIWGLLATIPDPEIPVLTITDLGMVRRVVREGAGWTIHFTPTYSGCPATEFLVKQMRDTLTRAGHGPVDVAIQLSPAWTTDWLSPPARERLRHYGISPPQPHSCHAGPAHEVACPRCASLNTALISEFGSTACKALYRCNACCEPFDYFKCI